MTRNRMQIAETLILIKGDEPHSGDMFAHSIQVLAGVLSVINFKFSEIGKYLPRNSSGMEDVKRGN